MRTRTTRVLATIAAAGVVVVAAGPALAAEPLARAEAEAISLSVAGRSLTDQVGGPYGVTRTADGETATGDNRPPATLLTGQDRLHVGTLAQDATTRLEGRRGSSAACAGVAGDGATLVATGDAGDFCLTPGETASLTAGALDLTTITDVSLVEETPGLRDVLAQIPLPVGDALDQLNDALGEALAPFGEAGLVIDLGAVQSRCTAGPGSTAEGSARLTDVGAHLQLPEGAPVDRITLLDLPTDPAPNTKVATDLDEVVELLVGAMVDSLEQSDLPDEVTQGLDTVRGALRDNLTERIADQLGPLEDTLLDGTLNKQVRTPGAIEVTAVDLQVLPAAAEQAGFVPVDARLARVSCGPGGAEAAPPPSPPVEPTRPPAGGAVPQDPTVPRSVPAGLAEEPLEVPAPLALAALVLLATGTGIAVHRHRSRA